MSNALDVRHLSVDIAGSPVLVDIVLSISPGAFVGLIGRNGAGKTTLMRGIMGLMSVRSGEVAFQGMDLCQIPPQARAGLGIGYMPEDRRLVPELTAEENVLLPAWATGMTDVRSRLEFVYGILPEVCEFAQRHAVHLSGGQQKLTALARALICGRRLLLLDEPFEGVAPALARRLVEAISALKGTGVSMLLTESDYVHSSDLVDRLYVIERGVVEARATPMAAV